MFAIAMTAWKRPAYLKEVLGGIKKNDLSGFEKLYINVEPGCEEVKRLVQGIDFLETSAVFNASVIGLPQNPYNVMTRCFENKEVDFVTYIQDDCLLANDAFDLYRYCLSEINLSEVFSICPVNPRKDPVLPEKAFDLFKHFHFDSLGYGMTRHIWESFAQTSYLADPDGYDWALLRKSKALNYPVISPWVGRARHIGIENGVHYRSAMHDKMYSLRSWKDNDNKAQFKLAEGKRS